MRFFKSKRFTAIILALCFLLLYLRHDYNVKQDFYEVNYEKTDISQIIMNEELSEEDYNTIFQNTGVSPKAAKELISNGDLKTLEELNNLYFEKPLMEKEFIAYPVTVGERNAEQMTPIVNLQKGDILVTFNTHTFDWRHGHCGIVLDAKRGILLEHMSIGNPSCFTYASNWSNYPAFIILRYPDEKVAEKASEYAKNHLVGIDYNILAGVIKKDKTDENVPSSSHCSHIVWQAYKAIGVDIDPTGGIFVTPENIAMSDKLEVLQIYGMNPGKYKDRLAK